MAGVLFAGTGLFAADGYSANATATLAELQPLAITNCCGNPTNATGVEPLVKTLAKEPLADNATPTNATAASAPIYVPDFSHANDALPDGVLAWNSLSQSASVPANSTQAHFLFSFTNVTSGNVSISTVHPSCGCTTADLPPLPWTIPAGGGGQIPVTVNLSAALAGSEGTLLKAVTVITDKGSKQLLLRINILPPVIATQTDAERTNSMAIAKADRQAIFKADCATCHAKPGEGKYGKALYEAVCAVCHDAEHRADIVPDLHTLTRSHQPRILAHLGRPRQARLAHARVLRRRRRPAQRHANRHPRHLPELRDPVTRRHADDQRAAVEMITACEISPAGYAVNHGS